MSSSDIYIGNIRKCTEYIGESHNPMDYKRFDGFELNSELYKENAILLRTNTGRYVDVDSINSIIDVFKIKNDEIRDRFGFIMPTLAYKEDCLYVDKKSLRLYDKNISNNLSIKILKCKSR